jgi:hypothetical protein
MALNTLPNLGAGGAGFQGDDLGSAAAMVKELQGFRVELLTGAGANTKINVAAIRSEDTILSAINNNASTLTDQTANMSIVSVKASGTLTLSGVVALDACTVNGKTYTFQAGDPTKYGQVKVGVSDDASAINLAAAINAYETSNDAYLANGGAKVSAARTSSGVVTVTAVADGTSGNSIGTTGSTHITAGGATLTGGTDTGGVKCTNATNQLLLFWFNKR